MTENVLRLYKLLFIHNSVKPHTHIHFCLCEDTHRHNALPSPLLQSQPRPNSNINPKIESQPLNSLYEVVRPSQNVLKMCLKTKLLLPTIVFNIAYIKNILLRMSSIGLLKVSFSQWR